MDIKVSGKLGRKASWAFILILALFIVFGVVFLVSIWNDMDSDAVVPVFSFFILWILVCLIMIIYYVANLIKKKGVAMAELHIETEHDLQASGLQGDPMEKLRSLEKLRKDGLISEDEYKAKRQEIMGQKW